MFRQGAIISPGPTDVKPPNALTFAIRDCQGDAGFVSIAFTAGVDSVVKRGRRIDLRRPRLPRRLMRMDSTIRYAQAILLVVALMFALAMAALVPPRAASSGAGTTACDDELATLLFDADVQRTGQSPFEVELLLSNEGDAAAANIVLGFEAAVGGQFLDEATFGNGQLWWPHGQRNAAVLYAAGDLAAGTAVSVHLTIEMLPLWGPGDPVSIFVSVVDAECVDDRVDVMFVRLAYPDGEAPTPDEAPASLRTATTARTPVITAAAAGATKTIPSEAQATPVLPSAPSAVPTAATTSEAAASGRASLRATAEAVLGEEAAPPTPLQSTPTQPPTGDLPPAAGDGLPGPDGRNSQALMVAALAAVALVVAVFVGRRLG